MNYGLVEGVGGGGGGSGAWCLLGGMEAPRHLAGSWRRGKGLGRAQIRQSDKRGGGKARPGWGSGGAEAW
jgi:hypothetical protein